jgi:hypothetical protein
MNPEVSKDVTYHDWIKEVRTSWDVVVDWSPFPSHIVFYGMGSAEFHEVAKDLLQASTLEPNFDNANIHPDELMAWFNRARTARKLFIDGYQHFGRTPSVGETNKSQVADSIIMAWRGNRRAATSLLQH